MAKTNKNKDSVKTLLYVKKSHLESSLDRTKAFISGYTENLKPQLPARIAAFKPLLSEYNSVIQDLAVESCDHVQDLEDLEETYFTILSQLEELLGEPDTPTSPKYHNLNTLNIQNIKLPQISLPFFNGDLCSWKPFYDNFSSLIVNNETLSDVQKFHYLKSSLKGQASDIVANLPITQVNFQVAWQLIQDRYDQPRLIIQSHVNTLLTLPSIKPGPSRLDDLRELTNIFFKAVRALNALKQNVDEASFILVPLLTNKLDTYLLRAWETDLSNNKIPKLSQLEDFLIKQINILQASGNCNSNHKPPNFNNSENKPRYNTNKNVSNTQNKPKNNQQNKHSYSFGATSKPNPTLSSSYTVSKGSRDPACIACPEKHRLYLCPTFASLPVTARIEKVKQHKLCVSCFNDNHNVSDCKSLGTCRVCRQKHNTLLHVDTASNGNSVALSAKPDDSDVLLATALVDLSDSKGNTITVRCLMDSGSQCNFISKNILDKLNLKRHDCHIPVKGIDQCSSDAKQYVYATVQSRHNKYKTKLKFLVLRRITENVPQENLNIAGWEFPPNAELSDPGFHTSNEVQILIGAGIFFDILSQGRFRIPNTNLTMQETKFGWIVSGHYLSIKPTSTLSHLSNQNLHLDLLDTQDSISDLLVKFWEVEEAVERKLTPEESVIEQHYIDTTYRDKITGRYIVKLPFKGDPTSLGESYETAYRRFISLERRLARNPELYRDYSDFIKQYIDLGHMTEIPPQELTKIFESPHYVIPHHPVIKKDSLTTKLRVVFNASAATSTGISLNDILEVGPKVQESLFSILLRFRSHKYVLTADVEKMYRQIFLDKTDTAFQLIFWRESPEHDIKLYRLETVTYGTAPGQYLSVRTVKQLANDEADKYPMAHPVALNDLYVDDLLTGTNNLHELSQLQSQLDSLFRSGCMLLRKWCSNEPSVLKGLENIETDPNFTLNLVEDESVKTLGVVWKPNHDVFEYKINFDDSLPITKRNILSEISRIYDPLHLLGPCIILAKLFIQELWLHKIGWDESLTDTLADKWLQLKTDILTLNNFKFPRCVFDIEDPCTYELHGFSDASEKAYGAVFYLKSLDNNHGSSVQLLCARSRVAPLKSLSLPRLELLGAVLLTDLYISIQSSLKNLTISKIMLWTDSTIVLHWINGVANRWKSFVSNRVSHIQRKTPKESWFHVSSQENPADILSRGSVRLSDLWLTGPNWLRNETHFSPPTLSSDIDIPESKPTSVIAFATINDASIPPLRALGLDKISCWSKMYRVVALLLRFKRILIIKSKGENYQIHEELSVQEIQEAQICIIRMAQFEMFPSELDLLQANKPLPQKSSILSLSPFLNERGVIRVGGRLRNSSLPQSQKHPILLSSKHFLTELIVRHYHQNKILHGGPQQLLFSIRIRYWIIGGKNLCRKVTRECVVCYKVNPKPVSYIMGDLPFDRVNVSRPFTNTGIDYAGPVYIKQSTRRNAPLIKGYIALFVCMTTKAIHLELCSDLSTATFIAALQRFVARRGLCHKIYCDNAKNFVGAQHVLHDLYQLINSKTHQTSVSKAFLDDEIKFVFIPAKSPTFGGLWEAGVKSMKHHLRRVMGLHHFTFEELNTIVIQIESQLNSRPLFPLSPNPNDLEVLSPSHFLVGGSLQAIPGSADLSLSYLQRWQRVQQVQNLYWKRWTKDYLGHLQQRIKWKRPSEHLQAGSLVLLKEDDLPPLKWAVGRVIALHPGKDTVPRVASVRTSSGIFKRAVTKLCPLPIHPEAGSPRPDNHL